MIHSYHTLLASVAMLNPERFDLIALEAFLSGIHRSELISNAEIVTPHLSKSLNIFFIESLWVGLDNLVPNPVIVDLFPFLMFHRLRLLKHT